MGQVVSRWAVPAVRLPLYAGEGAVLMQDWLVAVGGWMFTVPAGTSTDGASIPRVYAALVHDYLYGGGGPSCVTRADADAIYRALLVALGWGSFRAGVEYYALRLFGGSHWTERTDG